MTAVLSLISLCLGTALACYAPRAGKRVAAFEACGGTLVVGGLALLGSCLPLFR